MATTTITNVALDFEITYNGSPISFECQVIDASLSLPGVQVGGRTEVACPCGSVTEPGSPVNGALTGNIFVDSKDTGITWALAQLYNQDNCSQGQSPGPKSFPYSITYYADQANTIAIKFSGNAVVNSFTLPFTKPGYAKQPIDLVLTSATIARPTTPLATEEAVAA